MPKHYALNTNLQHYTVKFENTKVSKLTFDTSFSKPPMVQVTPNDSGTFPIYKTGVTSTGVKIRCKTAWSGEVDVEVIER